MDDAAAAPMRPEVLDAMRPYFSEVYGNPSSLHWMGRAAKEALDSARQSVADILACRPDEVYFTSGGTESDNLAVLGAAEWARRHGVRNGHVVTTQIEHPAVLSACRVLEQQGMDVTYLTPDRYGSIAPEQVQDAVKSNTVLVAAMYANNEVGTVLPVAQLAHAAKEKNKDVSVFTDAVQAAVSLPLSAKALAVDLLSLSAHKFGGPRGVGVLMARGNARIVCQMVGGGQENGFRAGTENVAGAVGCAAALSFAVRSAPDRQKLIQRRDQLIGEILSIPGAALTGHPVRRLPGHASFVFDGIEGEALVLLLDMAGVAASTGSACHSGSTEPSHVLTAMGYPLPLARSSLRLTFSGRHTSEELSLVANRVRQAVGRIRAASATTK